MPEFSGRASALTHQKSWRRLWVEYHWPAASLWNTVYLEVATNALRSHGRAVDDTLLQYLSPLGCEHINLTGDYLWRSSAMVGARPNSGRYDRFRRLNGL